MFLFFCFFSKSFRAESSLRTERLVSLLLRCHHFSTAIHLCACCQATPDTLGMRSECRSCRGISTLFCTVHLRFTCHPHRLTHAQPIEIHNSCLAVFYRKQTGAAWTWTVAMRQQIDRLSVSVLPNSVIQTKFILFILIHTSYALVVGMSRYQKFCKLVTNSNNLNSQFVLIQYYSKKQNKHFACCLYNLTWIKTLISISYQRYCEKIFFKQLNLFKFLDENSILQDNIWTYHDNVIQ